MQTLKKLYRASYDGEKIVTNLTMENNEWTPETEFVPNQVFNTHTTSQAVIIGNGESRLKFNLQHIKNHKGGLFAKNKLQSYGCNALYRDFAPDFLVAVGKEIVEEIANSGYTTDKIVYAHADKLLAYPEKFYLIPQNIQYNAGAIAAYLACFDGHTKVFLLGFDSHHNIEPINNVYKDTACYSVAGTMTSGEFGDLSLAQVASVYNDVEFVRIMPTNSYYIHPALANLPNFRQVDFRDFVIEADIG